MNHYEFEKEVEPFEKRVEALRADDEAPTGNVVQEIKELQKEIDKRLRKIYGNLDGWQTCLVARHQDRPHTVDYIERVFDDFSELHGDRMYSDDGAIVGGLARLRGEPVMVIGHEKGRTTEERIERNWGMPHPEGYRKALRLMRMAERFRLPLVTLVDTPGAFCGIGAEERGISQAIGANLLALAALETYVVSAVIGEGGSGGAIALAVCDDLLMLEHAVYSVITPEGCASILWKDGNGEASVAANAMGIRASDLSRLGLVDRVVPEPVGGAHRDRDRAAELLADALADSLAKRDQRSARDWIDRRAKRMREYGFFTERSGG